MPTPPLPDEAVLEAVEVWWKHGRARAPAAAELGLKESGLSKRLKRAAERGFLIRDASGKAMPGFVVSRLTTMEDADGNVVRRSVHQRPEPGAPYQVPPGHILRGQSSLVDADGRIIQQWHKTAADDEAREAAFAAIVQGFKDDLPRAEPIAPPGHTNADLLSQYLITDAHLGALAHHEETGDDDYDVGIAESLLRRFIEQSAAMSPASGTALLVQLGDFLHHDSHQAVTPEHRNLLDSDSRFFKIVRAAIRVMRGAVSTLLLKHKKVVVIVADANHDPASAVWLREMFAAFYENEPRVEVITSPDTYICYPFGDVVLFFHHGHRRKLRDVDSVLAGKFRTEYGRSKYAYAHLGHLHHDALRNSALMKIEQHETLAAKDAYAAHGGWLSGRSAKVITYHKRFGEVARHTLTPQMLAA